MSVITDVLLKKAIPYTYKIGSKTGESGIPMNVKVSIDTDFKKTVIKGISILSGGIALGIIAGFLITKK